MMMPIVSLSQNSMRCFPKNFIIKTEVPIASSKRLITTLRHLNGFKSYPYIVLKGSYRNGAISVNSCGTRLKVTACKNLKDNEFLLPMTYNKEVQEEYTKSKWSALKRKPCFRTNGILFNGSYSDITRTIFLTYPAADGQFRTLYTARETTKQKAGLWFLNKRVDKAKIIKEYLADEYRVQTADGQIRTVFPVADTPIPKAGHWYFDKKVDKDEIIKEYSAEESRVLKMLGDENSTDIEKDKLKVAYAEGYLYGNSNEPAKKTLFTLDFFQQFLSILFYMAMLYIIAIFSIPEVENGSNQIPTNPEPVKFNDVKGVNEAKKDLQEVVEFLKNPNKFKRVGGKLPKGILLIGPPGTGKTLLARALAGEAGVPFFYACGSEFDEKLVGVGARRVRELFKMARENAPCVLFIDEIDSVGGKRVNTMIFPHANQTVNQLLSEMDGFSPSEGVIVLGATNKRDYLDNALLRAGRFDVEISVPIPDFQGRKEIIQHYLGKVITAKDVNLDILARGTTGFTAADLEGLVNQAALRAAIDAAHFVTMNHLESARDKILMGPEVRSRVPDREANEITAYHETGHVLVAYYTKNSPPVHKVTIIPRGTSLGHTAYIPEKDSFYVTKAELLAEMDTMMGGRAAEELIFGPDRITTGAASDLTDATKLATRMVRDWAMSEKAGLRIHPIGPNEQNERGGSVKDLLDNEIDNLLNDSYKRAKEILTKYSKEHKLLAEKLLQQETLDVAEIKILLGDKNKDI